LIYNVDEIFICQIRFELRRRRRRRRRRKRSV